MSERDVELALRRMASQGKAGQINVAAPLNDVQFMAVIATMLHTAIASRDVVPPSTDDSVQRAMHIIAACKAAVVSGAFQKVLDEATGGPSMPAASDASDH